MENRIFKVYCDGSCWNGKPEQPMGLRISYFLDDIHLPKYDKAVKITWEEAGKVTTSILAELEAVIIGRNSLKEVLADLSKTEVIGPETKFIIYSDNQWVIDALNYAVFTTKPHLEKKIKNLQKLDKTNITFEWISRNSNARSNELSREALGKQLLGKDKKSALNKDLIINDILNKIV